MQGMHLTRVSLDSGTRGHQRLCGDLAAVGPERGARVAEASEDVTIDLGQVESAEEGIALLGAHGVILPSDRSGSEPPPPWAPIFFGLFACGEGKSV